MLVSVLRSWRQVTINSYRAPGNMYQDEAPGTDTNQVPYRHLDPWKPRVLEPMGFLYFGLGWIWLDLNGFGWIWMDLNGFELIWMGFNELGPGLAHAIKTHPN